MNNTTICAVATAPIILGMTVSDIYMIGMLIIAIISIIMPFILAKVNHTKVNEDDVKKSIDDAKDTLEELHNNTKED